MQLASWPAPAGDELAVCFDQNRERRLLVLPALFDEANKLRHFTVAVMRLLDAAGVDCFLPDMPGANESLALREAQTVTSWREAAKMAAEHFGTRQVLAIRGGVLLSPAFPCIQFAPVGGMTILRAMLRMQVMAEREAGREVTRETLLAQGREHGTVLAGYPLGAAMVRELEAAEPTDGGTPPIAQEDLGGSALWLRAEPAHDVGQAQKLAGLVQERLG